MEQLQIEVTFSHFRLRTLYTMVAIQGKEGNEDILRVWLPSDGIASTKHTAYKGSKVMWIKLPYAFCLLDDPLGWSTRSFTHQVQFLQTQFYSGENAALKFWVSALLAINQRKKNLAMCLNCLKWANYWDIRKYEL